MPAWLPLVAGMAFVALFSGLGLWQLSRGEDKRIDRAAFETAGRYMPYSDGVVVEPYQPLKVDGRYDSGRLLLLDHIVVDGRLGYYVIQPFRPKYDDTLLLVNRGWILKQPPEAVATAVAVGESTVTLTGRAGRLPRAAYRMGQSIPATAGWPRVGVYPTLDEVADALGEPLAPFVLLLDPDGGTVLARDWSPAGFGPERHYGYALQWFAMAFVLTALLAWNYWKKRLT